ncbi:hypothetical protein, partial [Phascolarctobacterium succinatutens]|uniref:hypothetical protein n=1 Tax=Phascolarctobacterium succinatutens TaxID=626940 RepID=UPI003AEF9D65
SSIKKRCKACSTILFKEILFCNAQIAACLTADGACFFPLFLVLSLIFPKNLSLILDVIKAGLSVFLAPALSKIIYTGAIF